MTDTRSLAPRERSLNTAVEDELEARLDNLLEQLFQAVEKVEALTYGKR